MAVGKWVKKALSISAYDNSQCTCAISNWLSNPWRRKMDANRQGFFQFMVRCKKLKDSSTTEKHFLCHSFVSGDRTFSSQMHLTLSSAGAPEVMSVWAAAVLQSRLQSATAKETPAGTPGKHVSSPHGALPTLPATAATQPHPGTVS